MHRKIRAVVCADDLTDAVETAVTGLENAMDDDVLPAGTLQTLVGEYAATDPFGPSTYFTGDREQTGYLSTARESRRSRRA